VRRLFGLSGKLGIGDDHSGAAGSGRRRSGRVHGPPGKVGTCGEGAAIVTGSMPPTTSGYFVIFSRFIAATLVAVSSLAMLASAAAASQAVTLGQVSLRAGPVDKSSELGTLGQGTKVSVVWCGPEVKFCLVRFHGQTGWVLADDLGGIASIAGPGEPAGKGGPGEPDSLVRNPPIQSVLKEAAPINPGNGGGGGPVFVQVNPQVQLIKPKP
jgi:hypothetical protein